MSVLLWAQPTAAMGTIRDAEIEHTLREITNPLLEAAGIPPESVRLFIVNNKNINAFVAGGLNIFIHTGLIQAAEKPGMLQGVIAHEIGHISGAHLTRLSQRSERANIGALVASVLGAIAVAGGAGEAGAAVIQGGQSAAIQNIISGIRGNEHAADQAALEYLDATKTSSQGMLEMFELLRRRETQRLSEQDAYARTHPLNAERIARVRHHVEQSPFTQSVLSAHKRMMHTRMRAKLDGFLGDPASVIQRYPASDQSVHARMARSVAYFRKSMIPESLNEIDALIKEMPKDAFLYDLKGQVLYEHGRLAEAISTYEVAHRLVPKNGLIAGDLGRAYLASETHANKAVAMLEKASQLEDSYSQTWRHLAIAYGRDGQLGMSHLALAEEAALKGEPDIITRESNRAMAHLEAFSPSYIRANDLQSLAKRLKEDS